MSIKYLVLGFEPIKHVSPTITTRPVLPPEVSSKLCPIVQIQCHGDTQIAVAKIKYQKFDAKHSWQNSKFVYYLLTTVTCSLVYLKQE